MSCSGVLVRKFSDKAHCQPDQIGAYINHDFWAGRIGRCCDRRGCSAPSCMGCDCSLVHPIHWGGGDYPVQPKRATFFIACLTGSVYGTLFLHPDDVRCRVCGGGQSFRGHVLRRGAVFCGCPSASSRPTSFINSISRKV